METIRKYFPALTPLQTERYAMMKDLYLFWNARINVISRKDMDDFYLHHVLYSLAIAKLIRFLPGTRIMDVGTGGGFPGIPLAIMFPDVSFHLVDSIGKKIKVADDVVKNLGLTNVTTENIRVENIDNTFDFITSRGVTAFPDFVELVRSKIRRSEIKNELSNGLLYLKGGDFADELKGLKNKIKIYPVVDFLDEIFFEAKKIIHMKIK